MEELIKVGKDLEFVLGRERYKPSEKVYTHTHKHI